MKTSLVKPTLSMMILLGMLTPLLGQMRIIPHLTRPDGGFASLIILANTSHETQEYHLQGYTEEGMAIPLTVGSLEGNMTGEFAPDLLFGRNDVSHFTIATEDNVAVSIAYEVADGSASPAHVREADSVSYRWRIYPGNWGDIIDGLAAVNMGSTTGDFNIRQIDASGDVIEERVAFPAVPASAKRLYLFETDFTNQAGAYFEIFSDQELAVTALRFSRSPEGPAYFWENRATPLPHLQEAAPPAHPNVGKTATFTGPSTYGVSGQAVITDERTITLQNFNYNGQGPDVRLVLAQDGDYDTGFIISEKLSLGQPYNNVTLSFPLPQDRTLDDFNTISVWCVLFRQDFGSGEFE